MDSLDEYALGFPSFYYQSARGKVSTTNQNELSSAIECFVDLFENLSIAEKLILKTKVEALVSNKNILEHLKTIWLDISQQLILRLQTFREDTNLGLDEDSRAAIAARCDPTLLTSTILTDEASFETFLKLYYDIEKQNEFLHKISNHISIREHFIVRIIDDYLIIHSGKDIKQTYCWQSLSCEAPQKKNIVHLLRIYADFLYRGHNNIQAVFKMVFTNPNLSLAKADQPIRKQHQPLDPTNPYEL